MLQFKELVGAGRSYDCAVGQLADAMTKAVADGWQLMDDGGMVLAEEENSSMTRHEPRYRAYRIVVKRFPDNTQEDTDGPEG